jgi:hypothetical protein
MSVPGRAQGLRWPLEPFSEVEERRPNPGAVVPSDFLDAASLGGQQPLASVRPASSSVQPAHDERPNVSDAFEIRVDRDDAQIVV